jgi:hypothetical protein
MSIENFVNPTYYSLKRVLLRSEFSDLGEIDITSLIPSMSIASSIDSETMYGTALVVDFMGLLENAPLRGEEQIVFDIQDSRLLNENGGSDSSQSENSFRFAAFIYKIDNVSAKDNNDGLVYNIHFISYQSFKAGTYQIIRSFRDERISDIVQTLFDDYYDRIENVEFIPENDRKGITIQETDGLIRCCIPKMRPEEAMVFLSKRAYSSEDSPSCTFRFFENTRGYHFVSDEELFKAALDDASENFFKFTYADAIPNTLGFFNEQLNNLETIVNSTRVNSLDDIYNGAYKNNVLELDILSRNVNLLDNGGVYKYFDKREKYFDVKNFDELLDRHTSAFIDSIHDRDEDVAKSFIVIQTYTKDEEASDKKALPVESYYGEIASNRTAYEKHIHSITLEATGPGRFDITAGDIVELDIKKIQFADGNKAATLEKNKHLNGRYIVKSVTYQMNKEEMKNRYTLIKKDWSNYGADVTDGEIE